MPSWEDSWHHWKQCRTWADAPALHFADGHLTSLYVTTFNFKHHIGRTLRRQSHNWFQSLWSLPLPPSDVKKREKGKLTCYNVKSWHFPEKLSNLTFCKTEWPIFLPETKQIIILQTFHSVKNDKNCWTGSWVSVKEPLSECQESIWMLFFSLGILWNLLQSHYLVKNNTLLNEQQCYFYNGVIAQSLCLVYPTPKIISSWTHRVVMFLSLH